MANKLDKIIVIDIESTCWESKTPDRLHESEIIEIGVCVLDMTELMPEKCESILVFPEKSTISPFCTDLTTITQEMIDESGISFKKSCDLLRNNYNTNNRLWASWGDYDRRQFERQCKRYDDVKYPFGPTHLNVKNLFAIQFKLSREVGMLEALKFFNLPLEGTHHRGVDDAQNIAKIACKLLKINRK